MSFKRSSACMLAAPIELPGCDPAANHNPYHSHKRLCSGPSSFTAPHLHTPTNRAPHHHLELAPHPSAPLAPEPLQPLSRLTPEVQAFLWRQLSPSAFPSQGGYSPHALHADLHSSGLSDAVWQCFGELNLDMEVHFGSLPARAIRGYHSFTRMPRSMLLQRYAATQEHQHQGQVPLQAQLVRLLLDKVLAQHPEAALVQYTLEVQPWMMAWSQRWGLAKQQPHSPSTPPLVSVAAVHVYGPVTTHQHAVLEAGGDMGVPGASGVGLPARVLYVPCYQ